MACRRSCPDLSHAARPLSTGARHPIFVVRRAAAPSDAPAPTAVASASRAGCRDAIRGRDPPPDGADQEKNMLSRLALAALLAASPLALAPAAAAGPAVQPAETPQAAVDGLLAADRAFAAAAAGTDVATGLSAMYDADVVVPLPGAAFARGKAAAVAALRANPANAAGRATWAPVRGGVSADGRHGFTFGFMTVAEPGKPDRGLKYLAYWVKRPEGWRVAAYKRAPRGPGEASAAMLPPALPARLVPPVEDAGAVAEHRASLDAAERAFSDESRTIGLGPAFAKYGRPDAMNMGRGPGFTMGAEAIGREIGSSGTPPVEWAPDDLLVASSGDLGVTWGMIRPLGAAPAGMPAAIPFFTVWQRAGAGEPWFYVAE